MANSLLNRINNSEFIITCELAPPKGSNTDELLKLAQSLVGLVDAINITDGQGGNMRMNSVVASHLVQASTGIPVICQMVCRDRNRIALQADILGAYALGVQNFLALHGDSASAGDNPQAADVFDCRTDDILKIISSFANGKDIADNPLNCPIDDLCVAAAAHPAEPDISKMKARVELGAKFFQTQIAYEDNVIDNFASMVTGGLEVPVLLGITPLKSLKMARFMNDKIYGVTVPQKLLAELESAEYPQIVGLQNSLESVERWRLRGGKGVHVMAVGQEKNLPDIITRIRGSLGLSMFV